MTNPEFLLVGAILVSPRKMMFNPGDGKSDKWVVSASVCMLIFLQKFRGMYTGFPFLILKPVGFFRLTLVQLGLKKRIKDIESLSSHMLDTPLLFLHTDYVKECNKES